MYNIKHYYFNEKELRSPERTMCPFSNDPRTRVTWVWHTIAKRLDKFVNNSESAQRGNIAAIVSGERGSLVN
jgi:hypothetical protein